MHHRVLPRSALIILPVIILISLFLTGSSPVQAVNRLSPVNQSSPDWESLQSKAQSDGSVRVIVRLAVPSKPEGSLDDSQVDIIRQVQEKLLQNLQTYTIGPVNKYTFIPAMAFRVDSAGLDYLSTSPLVSFIQEDIPVPPTLDISIPLIHADDAWVVGYSGSGQTVAILDTGVDSTHPFLSGKVVEEACYSTTDPIYGSTTLCPNGQESQIGTGAGVNCPLNVSGCKHGTHVAGIAAGDGAAFDGVARDASVIAIQVFSKFPGGICGSVPSPCVLSFTSDQMLALERVYALRNTYSIAAANMSLGGGEYTDPCDTDPRKLAVDNLVSAGIATVISSGNNGFVDAVGAPGCIPTAITVGATTSQVPADQVANYSNAVDFLDLLAPGSDIYSSVPGGGFESWGGTSMAAPHVTGAWAVLKSHTPTATVNLILTHLRNTGIDVFDSRNELTFPRIEVAGALGLDDPPGAFSKSNPTDHSAGVPTSTTLSWDESSNAYSYDYCLDTSDNDHCDAPWVDVGTDTMAFLSNLDGSTAYYWQVRAVNYWGSTDADLRDWWDFTTSCATPAAPTLVSPEDYTYTNDTTPLLDWTPAADADEYIVYMEAGSVITATTALTEFTPPPLTDETYTWKVRGHNTSSGCDIYGPWSDLWTFEVDTTAPSIPSLILPADQSTLDDSTPYFEWSSSQGASQYQIQVSDTPAFTNTVIEENTSDSYYTESISLSNATYYWRVRAGDQVNNWSDWSTVFSFALDTSSSCYLLSLTYTGSGSSPTANPDHSAGCQSGEYIEGEAITLTAYPASGWYLDHWDGTDSPESGQLIMPASNHTVTSHYLEIEDNILFLPYIGNNDQQQP